MLTLNFAPVSPRVNCMQLLGLPVVQLDLPSGFILISETRLH